MIGKAEALQTIKSYYSISDEDFYKDGQWTTLFGNQWTGASFYGNVTGPIPLYLTNGSSLSNVGPKTAKVEVQFSGSDVSLRLTLRQQVNKGGTTSSPAVLATTEVVIVYKKPIEGFWNVPLSPGVYVFIPDDVISYSVTSDNLPASSLDVGKVAIVHRPIDGINIQWQKPLSFPVEFVVNTSQADYRNRFLVCTGKDDIFYAALDSVPIEFSNHGTICADASTQNLINVELTDFWGGLTFWGKLGAIRAWRLTDGTCTNASQALSASCESSFTTLTANLALQLNQVFWEAFSVGGVVAVTCNRNSISWPYPGFHLHNYYEALANQTNCTIQISAS